MSKKIYVVSGASSDIGMAFLERLEAKKEPAIVFGQYHSNADALLELKEKSQSIDILPYKCDLSKEDAVQGWIEEIKGMEAVPTHILHLAACRMEYMRLREFDWEKTVAGFCVQVNTLAQLFKVFLPQMARAHYGKVAVMLSAYTVGVPPKCMSDYVMGKYALLGLMRSACSEYPNKGITINGLSPNMVETKFLSGIDPRIVELAAEGSAMKRNISIDEVVDGLEFLLSDKSNYMNGVNLNLSGGDRM